MYDFNFQKHAFFGKLDGITNDYNNEYHSTIKINPVDVKSSTYIDLNVEKKKVGDDARTSKHRHIFEKCYTLIWTEEVFVIKKVKNAVSLIYVMEILNGNEKVL